MGLLKELWTGELIKKFRFVGKWLSAVPSANQYVNNNTIHMVDVGADPNVLIDNTVYPIATAGRTDVDVAVALKKFDTENTKITEDELYALPYDKKGSVITQHREVLEQTTAKYGLYSLTPAAESGSTPLIDTTGASDGGAQPRKRMKVDDIVEAKAAMDALEIPEEGRILILCSAHVRDLLLASQLFKDQYHNIVSGKLHNLYGFRVFTDVYNAVYTGVNKKAYGAAAIPATDRDVSTFFFAPRTFKARGTVTMFSRLATEDPENRESVVGFRLHHIVLPKKTEGFGVIASTVTV